MSPAERACWDRLLASAREYAIARFNLNVDARECAGVLRNFQDAWVAAESRTITTHPDLAELNVQMDGFYS